MCISSQRLFLTWTGVLGAEHDRLHSADIYHNLGFGFCLRRAPPYLFSRYVYDNIGQLPEALAMYEKARTIRERFLGTDHLITVLTVSNIAQILKDQKKYSVW